MPTWAALPLNDIAHILFGMHVILFFFSIILLFFFSMLLCTVCVYLLDSSTHPAYVFQPIGFLRG